MRKDLRLHFRQTNDEKFIHIFCVCEHIERKSATERERVNTVYCLYMCVSMGFMHSK